MSETTKEKQAKKIKSLDDGTVKVLTKNPSDAGDYVLEIEVAERVYRYMIYEEHGTVYAEVPYEGVYKIDREAIYLLK